MKPKIMHSLAKFYLRYGRGNALMCFVIDFIKNIFYLGGIWYVTKEWFGITLDGWIMVILAVIIAIAYYIIGYIDEKSGFWKFQNEYATDELNPFFTDMKNDIADIKRTIGAIYKKL